MEYIHKFIRFLVGYFQRNSTLDTVCEHYSHISFDIFDTLIERKCRNPKEVFSLVEQRYNQTAKVEIHGFKELRQNAEKLARRNTLNEEVTLDDIYQNIAEIYGVNASNLLKDLEIKVELEQCVAINPNVMLYNKCVDDQNKKVYITSDMYLPKEVMASKCPNIIIYHAKHRRPNTPAVYSGRCFLKTTLLNTPWFM